MTELLTTLLDKSILIGFDVTADDIREFESSHVGLCGVDTARMSRYLLVQLTSAWKHRSMSTFAVTDVIQYLEDIKPTLCTADPRPFKGPALSGLWKAHFVDARFLVKNVCKEWGMFSEDSKKFSELCQLVVFDEAREPSADGWQGRLTHELVVGGYEKRASRRNLTGEWLIFGLHEGKRYYLALCTHTKGAEQDNAVYSALEGLCGGEFPAIFTKDTNRSLASAQ